MLTLCGSYVNKSLIFIHKYRFFSSGAVRIHTTRNVNLYTFPVHRLSLFERSPYYTSVKFFNQLLVEIILQNCIRVFRRQIFKFLVNIEPYNVR